MEQQPMDAQVLMERATELLKEIRKSEAYPALLGGIAGGIAGGLMAALIAGRATASRNVGTETVDRIKKGSADGGWSMREAVQLATVIAGLVKQVQAMYQERRRV